MKEGFRATQLQTWWPKGLNEGTTGGEHAAGAGAGAGARKDWVYMRHTFHRAHREGMEQRWKEVREEVQQKIRELREKETTVQAFVGGISAGRAKLVGQEVGDLERALRVMVNNHKNHKKKPEGDYIKLVVTHKALGVVRIRDMLRDPKLVERHPQKELTENMWVCEKNLPPVATWLLNYREVDKEEDLTEDQMEAFRRWD